MSKVRIVLDVGYEWEAASPDAEVVIEAVMVQETRRFAAAISDELERRGIEVERVRLEGDDAA